MTCGLLFGGRCAIILYGTFERKREFGFGISCLVIHRSAFGRTECGEKGISAKKQFRNLLFFRNGLSRCYDGVFVCRSCLAGNAFDPSVRRFFAGVPSVMILSL